MQNKLSQFQEDREVGTRLTCMVKMMAGLGKEEVLRRIEKVMGVMGGLKQ